MNEQLEIVDAEVILCPMCEEAPFDTGVCAACGYFALEGEGDVSFIKRTKRRIQCGCGEYAVHRHTYLLEGGRSNPGSSAYRGDDVSWCSDHEEFTCCKCKPPQVEGYRSCSRFSITPKNKRFAHMFFLSRDEVIPAAALSTNKAGESAPPSEHQDAQAGSMK